MNFSHIVKKTLIATFTATLALAVQAQDFGATLDNNSKIKKQEKSKYLLNQQNTASVWALLPGDNTGNSYMALQGSFKYKYDDFDVKHLGDKKEETQILDVDLWKYNYIAKYAHGVSSTVSLGRFSMVDSTGIIFSQNCDGGLVKIESPRVHCSVYGGYTGWQNAHNVTILNKAGSKFSYRKNRTYDLASSYAIGGLSLSFPYLLCNQTIGLEGYAFIGTNGKNSDNTDYNRYYGTLILNGPITKDLFYLATSTLGTEDAPDLNNLSQLYLTYFLNFYDATLEAHSIYASGENGSLKPFKGFTSNTATYSSLEPEYTGLLKSGISVSIKPTQKLLLSGGSDIIFICPKDKTEYHGTQAYGNLLYQIFTDVKVSGFIAHFWGKDPTPDAIQATLKATISF